MVKPYSLIVQPPPGFELAVTDAFVMIYQMSIIVPNKIYDILSVYSSIGYIWLNFHN